MQLGLRPTLPRPLTRPDRYGWSPAHLCCFLFFFLTMHAELAVVDYMCASPAVRWPLRRQLQQAAVCVLAACKLCLPLYCC
jgi:hypothetical protein